MLVGNFGGAEVTERTVNSRDLLTLIDTLCKKTVQETILSTFPITTSLGKRMFLLAKEASAAASDAAKRSSSDGWL
jgi:myo-inositol-1(or 4)-monophosphatase